MHRLALVIKHSRCLCSQKIKRRSILWNVKCYYHPELRFLYYCGVFFNCTIIIKINRNPLCKYKNMFLQIKRPKSTWTLKLWLQKPLLIGMLINSISSICFKRSGNCYLFQSFTEKHKKLPNWINRQCMKSRIHFKALRGQTLYHGRLKSC